MTDALTVRHATATRLGHRANNEDSAYAGRRLLALADGVGGEVAGEVASDVAVTALREIDTANRTDPVGAVHRALATANDRLAAAIEADPALAGMGTTATAILFCGAHAVLGHVGDSRAYRLRDGELSQLTRDDTYVQLLVEEGRISRHDARTHPQRALVTQVLQGGPVEVTVTRFRPTPGDRYLLCSDGLPDAVDDDAIAAALRAEPDLDACADRLVELALAAGGPDNVTVVVADVSTTGRWFHRWFRRR